MCKQRNDNYISLDEVRGDLAKLQGLPPYNELSNICWNDPYFAISLEKKYGMPISRLDKLLCASKTAIPSH